jgi:hypothetical protein
MGSAFRRGAGERGAITAEWALTLPAVVLTLGVVLGGIGVGVDHIRLLHAATEGQQVMSHGGSLPDATAHIHQLLGVADGEVTVTEGPVDHTLCVRVTRQRQQWWARVVGSDRTAQSCGLVVTRW